MQSWDRVAKEDALEAVLTRDGQPDRPWDKDAFFATGEAKVGAILAQLGQMGEAPQLDRALDFGCGVGRLSQALAIRFRAVEGVDISSAMIEQARTLRPPPANLEFIHNPHADLQALTGRSYTFALSLICLQHMREKAALGYIDGICGVLAPGGIAYLQVCTLLDPGRPDTRAKLDRDESVVNRLYRWLRSLLAGSNGFVTETHYCRLSEITRVLERRRMRLVTVLPDGSLPEKFVSHVVIFQRPVGT